MLYYADGTQEPPVPPTRLPRISGSAMPHGVFLSMGAASTASAFSLFLDGFAIVCLGMISLAPTYIITWIVEQRLHLSLPAMLLQMGGPSDPLIAAAARIALNLLGFLVFLTALRLSPLSGYHAAEHMTVHAIEQFGPVGWQEHVQEMPRAHMRCGSNLLAGILPALFVGAPLLRLGSPLALAACVAVALGGWRLRHHIGFFVQSVFTTKRPSPRQLAKGIEAGEKVLELWRRHGHANPTLAQTLWGRGVPQLVAGVVAGIYVLGAVADRLHLWLDW